ncbi:Norsolorinic acid ketoreductase nor1 like protein [Verticillium longisporum]
MKGPAAYTISLGRLRRGSTLGSLCTGRTKPAISSIAQGGTSVLSTSAANALKHFQVNTLGPLTLVQATADLLKASKTGAPKFVVISTIISSISSQEIFSYFPKTSSPYGASKTSLNWFIRLLSFEEPWLTSILFRPSVVETDLTVDSGKDLKALDAISVENMVETTFAFEHKEITGTFRNHDGAIIPW